MQQYFDRIIRAAKLDVNLYKEVEADKGAMGQAISLLRMNDYDMCRLEHERR